MNRSPNGIGTATPFAGQPLPLCEVLSIVVVQIAAEFAVIFVGKLVVVLIEIGVDVGGNATPAVSFETARYLESLGDSVGCFVHPSCSCNRLRSERKMDLLLGGYVRVHHVGYAHVDYVGDALAGCDRIAVAIGNLGFPKTLATAAIQSHQFMRTHTIHQVVRRILGKREGLVVSARETVCVVAERIRSRWLQLSG